MKNRVYFDSASTTPVDPEVLKQYKALLDDHYVNSESLYDEGIAINKLLNTSRKYIADYFKVNQDSIIFTSCASEANNLAIKGISLLNKEKNHIITTKIEHSSVLNAIKQLETYFGYNVTYLDVDKNGHIDIDMLKSSINDKTCLVSIMYVNNEIGSINDINYIKSIIKQYPKTYLHVDAVQALGKIDIDFNDIDLLTVSAHKIYGLKGSGILIKRNNVKLLPLINGGQQEFGLRGGTSDAIKHIMFAKTLRLYITKCKEKNDYLSQLKNYLITKISETDKINMNINDPELYIFSINTPINSEIMLNALNKQNIMVSALSTCHSASTTSHVLQAIGLNEDTIRKSIRISIDFNNTIQEIDYLINTIKEIIIKYE